jgi:Lectin C-type domain
MWTISSSRLLFIAVLQLLLISRLASAVVLDSSQNPSNGHTYYLLGSATGQSLNWHSAEAEAVALGGHLATITNAAENAWLSSTITSVTHAWIGLSDAFDGNFQWISDEPLGYTNWAPGEPNAAGTGFVIFYTGAHPQAGQWNDVSRAELHFGLAEVVPEPIGASALAMVVLSCLMARRKRR